MFWKDLARAGGCGIWAKIYVAFYAVFAYYLCMFIKSRGVIFKKKVDVSFGGKKCVLMRLSLRMSKGS